MKTRPLRPLLACALVALLASAVTAAVVRPAPSFSFTGVGGRQTLASLRGHPVVLLIAKTAGAKPLRTQLKNIKSAYHDCASRGALFVAALVDEGGNVPSDIPFILAQNGAAVAAAYGMKDDFLIAVIGRDGNLDLTTDKPVSGARVLEVIKNNADVQEKARRESPKGQPGR